MAATHVSSTARLNTPAHARVTRRLASLAVACLFGASSLGACAQAASGGPRKIHFSDCAQGAEPKCVPGNNSHSGTDPAAPRRDLQGLDINALPAGSQLLFARGGAWSGFSLMLRNLNATPAQPIVLDSYAPAWGGSARPAFSTSAGSALIFGLYSDRVVDGGYTVRNLKFDGRESAQWGIFIVGETRNITLDNLEISGFEIAIHFQNMGETGNTGLTIRNNDLHHNRNMGILGDAHDLVVEGNTIRENNYSGSGFNHGLYLGGKARNGVVRNNRFLNNSVKDGVCTGGNLTVHGQWEGLLIENNLISVDKAAPGCWGVSINDGYSTAEFFRKVVVRGNEVVNTECAFCVRAAPGIVIENNVIRSDQPSLPSGIVITAPNGTNDDPGVGAVVRNNAVCFSAANTTSAPTRVSVAGANVSGTAFQKGADARKGPCASTR